jgi:hypothetical protein
MRKKKRARGQNLLRIALAVWAAAFSMAAVGMVLDFQRASRAIYSLMYLPMMFGVLALVLTPVLALHRRSGTKSVSTLADAFAPLRGNHRRLAAAILLVSVALTATIAVPGH